MLPAPRAGPNTGITNVRKDTGIRCFKLGSQKPVFSEMILTPNADRRMKAMIDARKPPKEPKPISKNPFNDTKKPTEAPAAAPVERVFFHSIGFS